MSNELLVAIVGLIGSLCGSIIGVMGSSKLVTYRIAQLEQKFKEQCENCVLMDNRVDKLESRADVMEEKMKVANHRIENLERGKV